MNLLKIYRVVLTSVCMLLYTAAFAISGGAETNDSAPVKGVVKDQAGQPLIGVFVLEKGTSNGTMTDIEGNFNIDVPSDAVLEVSSMGYVTQEIAVGGKTLFKMIMRYCT